MDERRFPCEKNNASQVSQILHSTGPPVKKKRFAESVEKAIIQTAPTTARYPSSLEIGFATSHYGQGFKNKKPQK
jgi:hypothetical protein